MRGISSLIIGITIFMVIILASTVIIASYYSSQLYPPYISRLGEANRENLIIYAGIDGLMLHNVGLEDIVLRAALLTDRLGYIESINSGISYRIDPQETIWLRWGDLGFNTPEPGSRIIMISESGSVFNYKVYTIPPARGGDIVYLSGLDIMLLIFIQGVYKENSTTIDNESIVLSSNLPIPVNPYMIIINSSIYYMRFTDDIPESTSITYVEKAILISDDRYRELYLDDMDISYPIYFTNSSSATLVEFLLDYVEEVMAESPGAEVKFYTTVDLEIIGILTNGTLFYYYNTFDVFIHVSTPSPMGNTINIYVQPQPLAEIEYVK